MKKLSILLFAVGISTMAMAQPPKFGIKGGLNIATTHNTVEGASGSKLGANVGLLSHIHITPAFSLQPEIYYSNQGGKVGNTNVNLNYINIPLLLQYNFNNGFRLQTGPQLGFLVDVNTKENGNNTNYLSSDDFNSTDVAWSLGLSYLSYSGFGVDARYNLGLTKINEAGSGKTTNRVFQFGIFYLFDHNHKAKSR